jgi:hypothetical protein
VPGFGKIMKSYSWYREAHKQNPQMTLQLGITE